MALYVIQSDAFLKNHYFVVDKNNLLSKTEEFDKIEFERLQHEDELSALETYRNGGNGIYEVIRGKPDDFFIAVIKKTL